MPKSTPTPNRSMVEALLGSAILAPSSHNTQPWLFRIEAGQIELLADRTRALPVNDPDDRELTISCGCALFNLRVAAAAAGWQARVALTPDRGDHDLLARVALVPDGSSHPLGRLQTRIPARRTYRRRFTNRPVDTIATMELDAAVRVEGARLSVLSEPEQRHQAAALISEGDALLWASPNWRRELAAWMHPRRRGDGLSVPALAIPAAQMVVRSFDMGQGVGAKDKELADASPLLTVIATPGDAALDWLAAGQALQHALLVGLTHGLQASYLNQPVQVAALRPRLQALCGGVGTPQLLLRWGTPQTILPASPRRPLDAVMWPD